MKIRVTGGFIGCHTVLRPLARGDEVVGIDNINDYYDVRLKFGRLKQYGINPEKAARTGVHNSLVNPHAYIDSNIGETLNNLEGCRRNSTEHLAYASNSSVYDLNQTMSFSTAYSVHHPVSLYAATKKSNEPMSCYT